MRLRHAAAVPVLSATATAAQAGSVEWTRRRGGSSPCNVLTFAAAGGGGRGWESIGLSTQSQQQHLKGAGLSRKKHHHTASTSNNIPRRPRARRAPQSLSMQLHELSPSLACASAEESMEHKRRSVIRLLFNDDNNNNATEVSGWMNALKNLDGPEMPFDEMLELKSEMDKSMKDSKENTEKRSRRYKHFDLRRNPALLTKTEEIELGRKVQELLRWQRVRDYLELRLGRPVTMEEWALELAAIDGPEGMEREIKVMRAARARMISCNLRLVLHIARKKFYTGKSGVLKIGLEDMIQDGTAGLVKAVERFDPEKGFRFSTYATWWVHQAIHCGFADCGRVIRLPMNMHTMVCKVARLQASMVDKLGREPTVEELSLESGFDESQVEKCLRVSKVEPISLDLRLKRRGAHLHFEYPRKHEHIGDTVLSMHEPEPVDGADVCLLKTDVNTILGDLSAREAYVIRMRFGIGGNTPSTLDVVGRQLHVTRERVRQIQLAAIKKLRGRSPTHQVLYSDRAVAGEKDPATVTVDGWDDDDGDGDNGDNGMYGGLPPAVLIGLVKQALGAEPHPHPLLGQEEEGEEEGEEMLDAQGRFVTGARRRLMREAIQAERAGAGTAGAAGAAEAAAAAAAALLQVGALNGMEPPPVNNRGKRKKKKGFVLKRARSEDGRGGGGGDVGGGGGGGGGRRGFVAGRQGAGDPPVTRSPAWKPSLQAA